MFKRFWDKVDSYQRELDQSIVKTYLPFGGPTIQKLLFNKDVFFKPFTKSTTENALRVCRIFSAPFAFAATSLHIVFKVMMHLLKIIGKLLSFEFQSSKQDVIKLSLAPLLLGCVLFVGAISPITNTLDVIGSLRNTSPVNESGNLVLNQS